MIIIEGPDLAGKSTFCELLIKLSQRPLVYQHMTRLHPTWDNYWDYVSLISPHVVMDRFHLSEPVYAAACDRLTILTPYQYSLIDAKLRLAGAVQVLMLPTEELIRERWREGEMYDLETTLAARTAYGHLYASTYTPQIDFLIKDCDEDLEELAQAVIEKHVQRQAYIRSLAERMNGRHANL